MKETEKKKKAQEVTGVSSLAELAKKDFQKAYPVFVSPGFEEILREKQDDSLLLYETLKAASFSYQSLEEFLIGCGGKEPVELTMEETEKEFSQLEQSVRESVVLKKSGWGFPENWKSVLTGRFLRPEKKLVTTDEFVGNQYSLEYIIDTNFLHAGKNYGRIRISTLLSDAVSGSAGGKKRREQGRRERTAGPENDAEKAGIPCTWDFRLKRIQMQVLDRPFPECNQQL